jgi:hypothetical protein
MEAWKLNLTARISIGAYLGAKRLSWAARRRGLSVAIVPAPFVDSWVAFHPADMASPLFAEEEDNERKEQAEADDDG